MRHSLQIVTSGTSRIVKPSKLRSLTPLLFLAVSLLSSLASAGSTNLSAKRPLDGLFCIEFGKVAPNSDLLKAKPPDADFPKLLGAEPGRFLGPKGYWVQPPCKNSNFEFYGLHVNAHGIIYGVTALTTKECLGRSLSVTGNLKLKLGKPTEEKTPASGWLYKWEFPGSFCPGSGCPDYQTLQIWGFEPSAAEKTLQALLKDGGIECLLMATFEDQSLKHAESAEGARMFKIQSLDPFHEI